MEISVIASGSNGNCCLVEQKDASVLVDAGKSCKEIEARMQRLGKNLENVDAILLTHAHSDHSIGVGPVSRRYNIPVYAAEQVYTMSNIGKVEVKHFSPEKQFKVNGMEIKPIETSHDVPSCGFVIGGFGIFTDTGFVTNAIETAIKKLQGVVLESNHDIDMLINGRYPRFLKQRILSNEGHLSNIHASTLVKENGKELKWVLLAHLSANNNTPEKAKETFETIVKGKTDFEVLSRDKESGTWKL